ncbi:unnamed protein product [Bemisia tabaci]|uniref:Peptidase C1A papain C-terminal domain-containing protein n=1 Tax=Bemisia tabaci TaxID=7038 RepID=A0A9P0AAU6_BEMTA|nr:unnamed protein product [Bemisia tabaci]
MFQTHMFSVVLLIGVATSGNGLQDFNTSDPEQYISALNSRGLSWTAGENFPHPLSEAQMKKLSGTFLRKPRLPIKKFPHSPESVEPIPKSFDLRNKYPNCPSLFWVFEQSNCGGCYAIASASAMSDRICIASKGAKKPKVSAESIISCCNKCGRGCGGGYVDKVWLHFKREGDITGGEYNSYEGCQPYSIAPCGREGEPKCSKDEADTPKCKAYCTNPKYGAPYRSESYHGKSAYALKQNIEEIQREIMTYGSVVTGFTVYTDFHYYKRGVYEHTSGKSFGGHAVRVIGWGEEGGKPYWLAINSWGKNWGENGTFKIRRGTNECGFEKFMVAGEPKM